MAAMKPILYRVEMYIVPKNLSNAESLSVINGIDDIKFTSQFKISTESISENSTQNEEDASLASHNGCQEFARLPAENSKLIGIKIVKGVTNEDEALLDERLDIVKHHNDRDTCRSDEHLRVQKTEFQASIRSQDTLYPAKQFSRINSLMSIDERSESSLDTKLDDFCCHGYRNGCTASIPSPEDVSEEIFRENWLQKIEILKRREAVLRERELNLQNREKELFRREKELFRREKELRVTERILKERTKQMDQQLKYQKGTLVVGKRLEEAARILFDDLGESDKPANEIPRRKEIPKKEDLPKHEEIPKKAEIPKREGIPKKAEIPRKEDIPKKEGIPKKTEIPRKEDISKKEGIPGRTEIPKKEDIPKKEGMPRKTEIPKREEIPRDAEIPESPQPVVKPCEKNEEPNKKIAHLMRSKSHSSSRKSSSTRAPTYATVRHKKRPKIDYNDLNSTLSAASGDSLVRTSERFNPELYENPFRRSASERWPKHKNTAGKLQRIVEEIPEHVIAEDKIFRKVSDNISAMQEKEAKFQDYGLVDCKPDDIYKTERNSDYERKVCSYLDLEIGEQHRRRNLASVSKDRPVSWNEETNDWLQKKRQVYNSAVNQSTGNKENVHKCNPATNTIRVNAKSAKTKKFTLFR